MKGGTMNGVYRAVELVTNGLGWAGDHFTNRCARIYLWAHLRRCDGCSRAAHESTWRGPKRTVTVEQS